MPVSLHYEFYRFDPAANSLLAEALKFFDTSHVTEADENTDLNVEVYQAIKRVTSISDVDASQFEGGKELAEKLRQIRASSTSSDSDEGSDSQ